MAITFKKLKSPLLDFHDKIMVGKLTGCRVCDVIPEYYEYLTWAEKCGLLKFTKLVTESIQEHAGYKSQQTHYENEIAPYTEGFQESTVQEINFDDVPF